MAALVPSAGTITLRIESRSDAGAVSTPHPVRVGTLRRGCRPFRNRRAPHLNFFRTPVWKSIKRYSARTQFADCTKATNIRSPDAQRPVPAWQLNDSSELKETPMKFRPLHDRLVIERIDAESKTAGGLIIPDTAQEKPQQGKVIAVGPGGRDESGKLIPIDVKVGNRILFGKWSGTEVKIDGVDYLIMKENDVMGVLGDADGKKKAA
jgi:chaperonin GroES